MAGVDIDGQAWRRPSSTCADVVSRSGDNMGCAIHDEHPPFFTPSYLRLSRHVHRLRMAWERHLKELHESMQRQSSNKVTHSQSPSLGTSPTGVKAPHQHHQMPRGPVQDIVERILPPLDEDPTHPLPSNWNFDDRCPSLEILADSSEVRLSITPNPKNADVSACVRADHPMPRECGIYYFEVTILSQAKGEVGVGFAKRNADLNRPPGWEADSWAYHADDGSTYASTMVGKPYGPKFSTGDVVGCGVNFLTSTAFFTLNGASLGECEQRGGRVGTDALTRRIGDAFSDLPTESLYPFVGMRKANEHVRVNFGRFPFVFDIDSTVEKERANVFAKIRQADTSRLERADRSGDETTLIQNLIAQYLGHEGYVETFAAFACDRRDRRMASIADPVPLDDDDGHAYKRQKIRRSILDGDIDRAIKYIETFYPRVLADDRHRDVWFRLRCRKFVEMMRRHAELSAAKPDSNGASAPPDPDLDADSDMQMELDDQIHREVAPATPAVAATSSPPPSSPPRSAHDLMNAIVAYGRDLQTNFGFDANPAYRKQLAAIFATLAYTDPTQSVVGDQLDPAGRVSIAEDVNGAILGASPPSSTPLHPPPPC